MIAANRSLILAFDNISTISAELSDAFCRLATGGGFSTRKLYTDSDEMIFDVMRPILLNGITPFMSRQDLVDRSIVIDLPLIPDQQRRSEYELWKEFEVARPRILGALCNAASEGLRNISDTKLDSHPRMVDFAIWACAAAPALRWQPKAFLDAYVDNRADVIRSILEGGPLAAAITAFMSGRNEWAGTATELLRGLESLVTPELRGRSMGQSGEHAFRASQTNCSVVRADALNIVQGVGKGAPGFGNCPF